MPHLFHHKEKKGLLYVALALLAPFLAGTVSPLMQGVWFVLFGLLLCLFPCRSRPAVWVGLLTFGLGALGLLGVLPWPWADHSLWRHAVGHDLGISLSSTLSPQPWVTAESWLTLAIVLLWVVALESVPLSMEQVREGFRWVGVAGFLYATASILFWYTKTTPDFWASAREFGSFPNRNQTGNYLALSGLILVGLAYDAYQQRRFSFWIWSVGMMTVGWALVCNYSRAGILLFFGGAMAWLMILALKKTSLNRVATGIAVVTVLLSCFLLYGGETLARFLGDSETTVKWQGDFRFLIYRDAWAMAKDVSWFGVGLGNFCDLFPFYREASLAPNRALHPESDWFWMLIEMGWLAAFLVAGGLFFAALRILPFSHRSEWRLRSAGAVAVAAFVIHSFMDVSGHRLGTVLPALVILRLSYSPLYQPEDSPGAARWFRRGGFVVLALGLLLTFDSLSDRMKLGTAWIKRSQQNAWNELKTQPLALRPQEVSPLLRQSPLDWELYQLRATAELLHQDNVAARMDFLRARVLEPLLPSLEMQEGALWVGRDSQAAADAFIEAIRRAPEDESTLMRQALSLCGNDPAARYRLRTWALQFPALLQVFLVQASPEETRQILGDIRSGDPGLRGFEKSERRLILEKWLWSGGEAEVMAALPSYPEWEKLIWPWLAQSAARAGKYQQAYETAMHNATRPIQPTLTASNKTLPEMEQAFAVNPGDFALGVLLYQQQILAVKSDDALATLQRMAVDPDAPAYVDALEAELLATRSLWDQAWAAWVKIKNPEFESAAKP